MCVRIFTKSNGVFTPPPFLSLFLLEYVRRLYFNKSIGGLYAYNLVSCVDSSIRFGVAKLAPVSKKSIALDAICSECYRSAWSIEVNSRRLAQEIPI